MKAVVTKLIPWGLCTGLFVLWNVGCSAEKPAFNEGSTANGIANQNSNGGDLNTPGNADSTNPDGTDKDPNFIDKNGDGIDDNVAANAGGSGTANNVTTGGTPGGGTPGGGGPVTSETVTQYKNDCAMAQSKGQVKTFKQAVFFPAVHACPWSQGDNLARVNGSIQARVEQNQDVQFPKLSRLCGMKFNFPTQPMSFDDEIVLTFGKYVIGSSQDYGVGYNNEADRGFAKDADGYETYSWLGQHGMREMFYDHGVAPKHCLPGSTCSMPLTEMDGAMSVNIPDSEAIRLGLKSGIQFDSTAASQALKIGFVSTGDNDDSDCQHLDFRFDVTFSYVE